MASATKNCRMCGKEYEYCHTAMRIKGVFRWQDVACCPQHGSEYLSKIQESREVDTDSSAETIAETEQVANTAPVDLFAADDSEDEDYTYNESDEEEDEEGSAF